MNYILKRFQFGRIVTLYNCHNAASYSYGLYFQIHKHGGILIGTYIAGTQYILDISIIKKAKNE